MAEAATITTTSPKQLGKQLRAVRRRKGLSLSEVARGAGLSRRELVAYERGKVPIPESDLWVLAGSCGVDVGELVPDREPLAIQAGPSSMGDTIEFLRRGQNNGTNGRAARALEAAPPVYSAPAPAPDPVPETASDPEPAPEPEPEPTFGSTSPWTPSPAAPVDVFEELARLPEPVPLNPDLDEYPDFLSTPAFLGSDTSADAAYESIAPPRGTIEFVDDEPLTISAAPEFAPPSIVEPVSDLGDPPWTPADAPPIDVAHRGETFIEEIDSEGIDALEATSSRFEPEVVETGWTQPDWATATSGVWNEPDETPVDSWSTETPATEDPEDTWTHEPDPEAINTGFLVDWGDPDPIAPIGLAAPEPGSGTHTLEARRVDPDPIMPTIETRQWEPRAYEQKVFEPSQISWRPDLSADESPVGESPAGEPRAGADDRWTVADDDWELGNALPLVEVRGQGALVMRRADERWALASLRVPDSYVMEVDLEFRSGPGFGVLFRADVDNDGRMSAYSFDVDPVYEGGSYLVRQWQADRELWNPIAHVPAVDPTAMYGDLVVRLVVDNERLVAYLNDVEVMSVDDLNQSSIERGREPATGKRVGVQAWSSSDLVVETLRVADR